jgi:hypothetical protein
MTYSIFIVTLRDGYDQWTIAVQATDIHHAREVAEMKYDDGRVISVRRAK